MKRDFDFLYELPVLTCFDNDDGGDDGGGGDDDGYTTDFDDNDSGSGDSHVSTLETRLKEAEEDAKLAREEADRKSAQARQASTEAAQAKERSFNQDDMNRFLADDRRKHKEKYKKLEGAYQDMLADKNLAAEARGKLEGELEDLRKTFRSKKSNEEYERKKERERFTQEVNGYKEAATKWEHMYKDSAIQRSLQDSAIAAEAFNPAQIVGLLRPMTEMRQALDTDGNELNGQMIPKVDFPDINEETGQTEITLRTPQEAVQRMKELPEQWGNLFRANVVSGIGSGAATGGVTSGEGGRIDVAKLSPEQYRKMREENPEALGLRQRR